MKLRIRLTCDRAGPTGFHLAGEVLELPRDEAMRMLKANQAEPVLDAPEAAVAAPKQTAALPRPTKRGK